MSNTTDHTPWLGGRRPEWLTDVRAWLDDVLPSLGLGAIVGIESVRERPWSAVLRVTTSRGVVHFKAEGLGGLHEPALLTELVQRWDDRLPTLLAVDEARGWMLMGDDGTPLRETGDLSDQLRTWERILPMYAEMQQGDAVDRLVAIGLPDRRTTELPSAVRRLLAGDSVPGGSLDLDADERRAIAAILPDFDVACDELAATAALDHGDLHSGNVLVGRRGPILCDWGDASVTHPFCSLLVTFQLSLTADGSTRAAAVRRLRDAYLEAWPDDDRGTFRLAMWVAHVVRALDWAQMLQGADDTFIVEWRPAIADALRRWLAHHERVVHGDDSLEGSLW